MDKKNITNKQKQNEEEELEQAKNLDSDVKTEEGEVVEVTKDKENKEIKELRENILESESKYRRALADYQNLEKRSIEEKRGWIQLANKELLMRLLPAIDMLFLAAKHVKDTGLDMSLQQFLQALEQEGITKIDAVGKQFDPHLMEGIQTVEGEDGKVIDEIKSGYKLYDKVLRPAQVTVGKKKE